tara:strand:+ start:6368 stop:6808 length:441 start_codon:yes stop_codon:yes gene_type:complete
MFGIIENIVNKASKLDENDAWFQVIDRETQWEIIRLNTIDQLFDNGLKSDGSSLPDYSPESVRLYGKEDGHIKLKDTGQFYRSFVVKANAKGLEIIADTKKGSGANDDLAVRYGIDILGLTQENNNILAKLLTNNYIKYVRKQIFQ